MSIFLLDLKFISHQKDMNKRITWPVANLFKTTNPPNRIQGPLILDWGVLRSVFQNLRKTPASVILYSYFKIDRQSHFIDFVTYEYMTRQNVDGLR